VNLLLQPPMISQHALEQADSDSSLAKSLVPPILCFVSRHPRARDHGLFRKKKRASSPAIP